MNKNLMILFFIVISFFIGYIFSSSGKHRITQSMKKKYDRPAKKFILQKFILPHARKYFTSISTKPSKRKSLLLYKYNMSPAHRYYSDLSLSKNSGYAPSFLYASKETPLIQQKQSINTIQPIRPTTDWISKMLTWIGWQQK